MSRQNKTKKKKKKLITEDSKVVQLSERQTRRFRHESLGETSYDKEL